MQHQCVMMNRLTVPIPPDTHMSIPYVPEPKHHPQFLKKSGLCLDRSQVIVVVMNAMPSTLAGCRSVGSPHRQLVPMVTVL